ncbi:MAG: hypothetical protein KatS3mg064_1476 [Tepidiforma sp.]|nr:diguanylate cyclase [Tepidiforma sp.]GIW18319.1 MAG: hypothetical protein KatS3mg064_1476 [Tepidiforma sp.]
MRALWAGLFGFAALAGPGTGVVLFGGGALETAAELGAAAGAGAGAALVADRAVRRPLASVRGLLRGARSGEFEARAPGSVVRELDELEADLNRSLSALQVSTETLIYRAFHDPLTELPNRAMFLAACARALAGERRPDRVAVLFMDVDRFKYLNDTLGHGVGDQLLSVFAQRLVGAAEGQMVARLGGDEFTVLMLRGTGGLRWRCRRRSG